MLPLLLLGLGLAGSAVAANDAALIASAAGVCQQLEKEVPTLYKTAKLYQTEEQSYYHAGCKELKPQCIVFPTSKEQVSSAVKILAKDPTVKFAVKSGGHDPNLYHSSMDETGVLIALSQLNGTRYDKEQNVVYQKPGGQWGDVIGALTPYKKTVVGGRIAAVGIGGYLTMGGNSYLTSHYGMAADNVINFETVFANGSIINVNASNPGLYRAMKGSGNQFGIVTEFTLKAHPMDKCWGGVRMFKNSQKQELFEGLNDFIDKNNENTKAAIIFLASRLHNGLNNTKSYSVAMFYDGGGAPPPAGYFGKLGDVKPQLDLTGTIPYGTMLTKGLTENVWKMPALPIRSSFRSITLPWFSNYTQWYGEIEDTYDRLANEISPGKGILTAPLAFQPFPSVFGKHADAAGGNAMGLTGDAGNRFVVEIAQEWFNPALDKKQELIGMRMTEELVKQKNRLMNTPSAASSPSANGRVGAEKYTPQFMNDAHDDQAVFSTYSGYEQFKKLQAENDPNGLWRRTKIWQYNN